LRSNPPTRLCQVGNNRNYLTVSTMLAPALTATSAFGREPPTVSDLGNWVVVLFGLLLWASCLFALCALGIRAIFGGRSVRTKHHRNRPPHLR
jgi:hypothetical protein